MIVSLNGVGLVAGPDGAAFIWRKRRCPSSLICADSCMMQRYVTKLKNRVPVSTPMGRVINIWWLQTCTYDISTWIKRAKRNGVNPPLLYAQSDHHCTSNEPQGKSTKWKKPWPGVTNSMLIEVRSWSLNRWISCFPQMSLTTPTRDHQIHDNYCTLFRPSKPPGPASPHLYK